MILLALLGCWQEVEMHCEWEDRVPTDAETLDLGFSIEGALAETAEPQRVQAIGLDGTPIAVDVAVTRDEGEAALADATVVEEVKSGVGPNRNLTWVGEDRHCTDELTVPVVLDLASEDGAVALSGPATLTNRPAVYLPGSSADETVTPLRVAYTLDPAADRLPAGTAGAAVAGDVWITFEEGLVTELEGRIETADGTLETVLWFAEPR